LLTKNRYHFYCAECEAKVQAIPYFKTWCPCKESQVIASLYDIDFFGCAVGEEEWEAMIGTTNVRE